MPTVAAVSMLLLAFAGVIIGFMGWLASDRLKYTTGLSQWAKWTDEPFCDDSVLVDFGDLTVNRVIFCAIATMGVGFLASFGSLFGCNNGCQFGWSACLYSLSLALFLALAIVSSSWAGDLEQQCDRYQCEASIRDASVDVTMGWQVAFAQGVGHATLRRQWTMTCPDIGGAPVAYQGELRYCYACDLPDSDSSCTDCGLADKLLCANQYHVLCGGDIAITLTRFLVAACFGAVLSLAAVAVNCACFGCCLGTVGLEQRAVARAPDEDAR